MSILANGDGTTSLNASLPVKSKEEWLLELRRRQDNIDPIRKIPNVAFFEGTLIKGALRLNGMQRFGALLLGASALFMGCVMLAGALPLGRGGSFAEQTVLWIAQLPLVVLELYFGWKTTMNALLNQPEHGKDSK